jgi:O-antigen ligase
MKEKKMKKSLFILLSVTMLLVIFSLVSLALMGMGLLPVVGVLVIFPVLIVAYILLMFALSLRRKIYKYLN